MTHYTVREVAALPTSLEELELRCNRTWGTVPSEFRLGALTWLAELTLHNYYSQVLIMPACVLGLIAINFEVQYARWSRIECGRSAQYNLLFNCDRATDGCSRRARTPAL
jgi:hypothetical protein